MIYSYKPETDIMDQFLADQEKVVEPGSLAPSRILGWQ